MKMNEQELLEKIKKSAETVPIPNAMTQENLHTKALQKKQQNRRQFLHKVEYAAAILVCCILTVAIYQTKTEEPKITKTHPLSTEKTEPKEVINDSSSDNTDNIKRQKPISRKNAGSLYTVAKNYEEIYNLLESSAVKAEEDLSTTSEEREFQDDAGETGAGFTVEKSAKKESYSTTNLQTDGVDEADFIKTDGKYIYTLSDQQIYITDVSGKQMELSTVLKPDLISNDRILEMYIDQNRLVLAVQHTETSLDEQSATIEPYDPNDSNGQEKYYRDRSIEETDNTGGIIPLEESQCYKISAEQSTILYTYDLTNMKNPVLLGTYTQDGYYQTSRKIDDTIYLFTTENLNNTTTDLTDAHKNSGKFLPLINGKELSYDTIYLPENGNQGLMMSSIQLDQPNQTVDQSMIIHNNADIYVSTDALYLYQNDHQNQTPKTQIAKFSIQEGIFQAVGAASVDGQILDTFAINDSQGKLRVLTTGTDDTGESSNNLYLFNGDFIQTACLTGIAKGEQIYAARYFGDTAYFITYRNTDPLFAVDLSDEHDPKILGELKITGFSEYLHFWGNHQLLGIGYETDPESGLQQGLKLVMFDISNPTELNTIDSFVIKDAYYSPALYNYKCVLVDAEENLIGFSTDMSQNHAYMVFSFENGSFKQKLKVDFSTANNTYTSEQNRGIYIDNKFYIVNANEIIWFDRENNYQKVQHFVF